MYNKETNYFLCNFLCVVGIYYGMDLQCPILVLLGVPCPTCGVTHALIALLEGDINLYLEYHPLAIPLIISVILCLHLELMNKILKKTTLTFVYFVLFINTLLYLYRISFVFEM